MADNAWLAQRLHRIHSRAPALVPWVSLKEQFGFAYGRMDNFKRVFQMTLRQVHAVYPEARFSFDARGMRLSNSRPPVAKRAFFPSGSFPRLPSSSR
jgi:hypothetical protein